MLLVYGSMAFFVGTLLLTYIMDWVDLAQAKAKAKKGERNGV